MTCTLRILSLALLVTWMSACAGPPIPHEPDVIDVILPAPAEQVRTAVTQVLTDDGYDVDWKDDQTLKTGYRDLMPALWNGLLRWRFGTTKSRVEAMVAPASDHATRLTLHVLSEGKDGIFTSWDAVPSALQQSAENQLRLIKNALHIL